MVVQAAGAVLWRGHPDGLQVAVIHRPRRGDWSLPKGKLDPGETELAAAVREVREETGFAAVAGPELGVVRYEVRRNGRRWPKTVRYWAMEAGAGAFEPNDEVDEVCWLRPDAAADLLTYERDREILRRFCEVHRA